MSIEINITEGELMVGGAPFRGETSMKLPKAMEAQAPKRARFENDGIRCLGSPIGVRFGYVPGQPQIELDARERSLVEAFPKIY